MTSKHDQILQYIERLPIGQRISVRGIAKKLNFSEGTAYRAIKTAEQEGIVSTIERVGTIRIEKKINTLPESLQFKDIVSMIDGRVLGGEKGLIKHLKRFIIGAMTLDQIEKYYTNESIIIVGNRTDVQLQALNNQVAVLITGGFEAENKVIKLANKLALPVISTPFDTFSTATVINRSMADQEIKKDILTVTDYYVPIEKTKALEASDTIQTFYQLSHQTGLSRFPVHYNHRIIGVVTAKDLIGRDENITIDKVMTKEVVTVKKHMTIAYVSQLMVREDIEMLPVVADNLELLGVISRQDVMKALQQAQKDVQIGNTYEDDVVAYLEDYYVNQASNNYDYQLVVSPRMLNSLGTISYGVLCELIARCSYDKFYNTTGLSTIIEKLDLHYFNLIQISNQIQFKVEVFYQSRRSALMQVDVFHENSLAAKGIVSVQIIENI